MYTVDGVMIDIGVQSEKASSGLEKLANTLEKIKSSVRGGLGLENVGQQLNGINNQVKKFTGFTKQLLSIAAVTKAIGAGITKSNEYVENMNLFRVALGGYADEAQRYAEIVERIMGIDSSEWMRNQGTFMQIASGFGMAEDQAYKLSKALTQVSYDIASFYNISTEQAMLKVRSGIAGELEPLRNLGYALDTATLQQIAYANGINMKVNAMTQAQKAELRYVAIMSQSRNAINDMSRTWSTSANQIRVLTSQINILARAFGNILIPAINAVLPVVIMFVNAISTALNAIAGFFGFTLPTVDWSGGLSNASGAAEDLGNNLGSAGGSAKKLKRILMGFDELNVMPDVGGGGGGGGGGAAGGFGGSLGINIDDYMYDFLDGMYKKAKDVDWAIAGIAAGLAGLAIPAATMLGWKNLSNILGGLITIGAQMKINFELASAYLKEGNVSYVIGQLGMTTLAGGIFTTLLTNAGFTKGGKNWKYGFGSALIIDAGVSLAAVYKGVSSGEVDAFSKEAIIEDIKSVLEFATAGFLVGGVKGAVVGAMLGITVALVANAVGLFGAKNRLIYGDVTLKAEEMREYAEKLLNVDVDAHLRLADTQVENVESAEEKLKETIANLQTSSNVIRLGIDTSDAAYTAVMNDAQGLIAAANTLLTEQERSLGLVLTLSEPVDKDGNNISGQLQTAATNAIGALRGGYEYLGEQLMDAIESGMDTGDFEAELIANLSSALTRVSSAVTQGELAGGYVADVKLALADLDEGSFKGVLQEVEKIKEELEKSYTELAEQQYSGMQGQLAGLEELKKQYESMGETEAANALVPVIEELRATIENYDIKATVDDMVRAATSGTEGLIVEALMSWIGKGDNGKKFGDQMQQYINDGLVYAANNGDVGTVAYTLIDIIEAAFEKNGIDLSEVGITGADFLTDDFRSVIDEALKQTGISQNAIDQIWDNIANNPVWSKTGKIAAQRSIDAIKSQYETAEDQFAPVTAGMADTLADMLSVELNGASDTIDYVGIAGAMKFALESKLKERGISLADLTFNGTELLTDTFKEEVNIALRDIGVSQATINQLWNTFKNAVGDGIVASVRNSKTGAVSAMTEVVAAIKREANKSAIKIKVGLKSDGSALKVTGAGGTGLDVKTIQLRAGGGIPDYGSMFIAGEAGPELVGRIGSKTGVVNDSQISEIIAAEMARQGGNSGNEDAIANAVAAALNNMELKVDGDSFGRIAVKTINKRRQTSGKVELIL